MAFVLEHDRYGLVLGTWFADVLASSLAAPPSRLARTSTLCSGTASKSPPAFLPRSFQFEELGMLTSARRILAKINE